MQTNIKLNRLQPRLLRYRNHYKIYILAFLVLTLLVSAYWGTLFAKDSFEFVLKNSIFELCITGLYFLTCASFYFFWLKDKLSRSVQVFADSLMLHHGRHKETLHFADIESLNVVCWSIFYLKMKNGHKHYFNSGLERVDYIWEGIYQVRPDLMNEKEFEDYRVKLVQYDHHQKRKEWFFKHKLVDIFNWIVLPAAFLGFAYVLQSRHVVIHHQWLYFFRLFMYAMLVVLSVAFFYSMVLKKLIFDKKVKDQMSNSEVKVRDMEFEGVVLQRSKIFQLMTTAFVLALVVRMDMNFYSVSKVKDELASFNLKRGSTVLVDNRYNCVGCEYSIQDGDLVVFERGIIGQVLAQEGDMVGQIGQDDKGRMIASENVQEVPRGHVAVRAGNGKDISFVKIQELIGKIQK